MTTRQIEHEAARTTEAAREVGAALQEVADASRRTVAAALDTAQLALDDGVHAAVGAIDLAVARAQGRSEAELLRGDASVPLGDRLRDSFDRLGTRGRRVTNRLQRRAEEHRVTRAAGVEHGANGHGTPQERIAQAFDEARDRGEEAVHRLTDALYEVRGRGEALFAEVADEVAGEVEERIHEAHVRYEDRTVDDLYRLASERHIHGRSSMTKAELIDALRN